MSDFQEPFEEKKLDEARQPRRPRPPSVFWPIVLIGAGIMLLLSSLGYVPWQSWGVLWRLWPLLIIALGIDVLIGHRSVVGAIVSAVLLFGLIGAIILVAFFAQNIPVVSDWIQPAEFRSDHVESSLTNVERAEVYISWTSVPGYLNALEDSPNLIEADVDYVGELTFRTDVRGGLADVVLDSRFTGSWFGVWPLGDQSDKRWDVGLSPDVPLDLNLDAGSGPCDFDLIGLQVSGLVLDAGSGPIDLALPSGSSFDAKIDGGSGPVSIVLPQNVGLRVELDSGSGPFSSDSRFELVQGKRYGDGVWETYRYDAAEYKILLVLDQGSGPVSIR